MRLFPLGPRSPRLSVPELLENAQWHGTDREDWVTDTRSSGLPIHSGTADAAVDRMKFLTEYGGAEKSLYYPVHLSDVLDEEPSPDPVANAADVVYSRRRGLEPTDSVRETASYSRYAVHLKDDPFLLADEMSKGRSISYKNDGEIKGSISHVSPQDGFSTLRDADLGLAKGTGWRPREYFTEAELQAQGFSVRPKMEHPRLFEESSGEYHYNV